MPIKLAAYPARLDTHPHQPRTRASSALKVGTVQPSYDRKHELTCRWLSPGYYSDSGTTCTLCPYPTPVSPAGSQNASLCTYCRSGQVAVQGALPPNNVCQNCDPGAFAHLVYLPDNLGRCRDFRNERCQLYSLFCGDY